MIRGIERRKIFRNKKDREDFLNRLGKLLTETQTTCYGWALIPNHAHFLFRTGQVPLATVMRRLLTGYVLSFNRRHKRHGHLFQSLQGNVIRRAKKAAACALTHKPISSYTLPAREENSYPLPLIHCLLYCCWKVKEETGAI
jgi:REP element-mobilizing transposase RayT